MTRTLGLDLGIASIGWCLFDDDTEGNPIRIRDIGSFVYNQIENPKSGQTENIERRQKRLMRRQRRRKVRRLEDARYLFKKQFNLDFLSVVNQQNKDVTPFDLKVKGLTQKLTPEELCIALYHYLKYRGYKSNRKIDAGDESDKKILKGISTTRNEIADRRKNGEVYYISQYLLDKMKSEPKELQRIHNTSSNFNLTVARDMYQEEINALLDAQISFGVIDKEFKEKYIDLFSRQRDFSEGPAGSSKYHVSIDNMIGNCDFDGEKRAPKDSLSASRFVLLSSLNNLFYKSTPESKYTAFTPEQIVTLEKMALEKKTTTYNSLFKKLGIPLFRIKGLSLSRKEYRSTFAKFCTDEKIVNGNISTEQYSKLNQLIQDKTFDKTFFKNSEMYCDLKKAISDLKKDNKTNFVDDDAFYDEVANILLVNKTDQRINEVCKEKNYPSEIIEEILKQKNVTKAINLSLSICQKLVPYLEKGLGYDKAMLAIGYNHSSIAHAAKIGYLPDIDTALKEAGLRLTNPVVKHTLVKLRNVVNAISEKYGCPEHFSIELTRELGKSFEDRRDIRNTQLENQDANMEIKTRLVEKYPNHFHTIFDVSRKNGDILRYKLFMEQKGMSPYTNQPINESEIFDDDCYQIDHIIPYSQSFDDSYNNKVLVEAKANQEKKNRLPLEYLVSNEKPLKDFINKTPGLSRDKIANLLATEVSSDFKNKDFQDSSYIATLAKQLIEYYLLPEGSQCFCTSGRITEKLRELWGLAGKTHSYRSSYEKSYSGKFISDYVYDSFEPVKDGNKESINFTFIYREKDPFVVSVSKKVASKNRPLSPKELNFNNLFDAFVNDAEYFKNRFTYAYHKGLTDLSNTINYDSVNPNSSLRKEAGTSILGLVYCEIYKDISAKDRSNDLHHALDAAVIGCVSHSTIVRLTKFFQSNEELYDTETGAVGIQIPQPYQGYAKEVLLRVYERDEDKLLEKLNELPQYQNEKATLQTVHVLLPVRTPEKNISGSISKDTIFGKDNETGCVTKRIPVDKLKKADLESMVDKNGGNKAVYDACMAWLSLPVSQRSPFPRLAKKGSIVRTVRIVMPTSASKVVDLSNGRYADNSDNIRVNVYRKIDGDQRYYFVPIYYYQITRDKIRREQLNKVKAGKLSPDKVLSAPVYTLMWKQGPDGYTQLSEDDLNQHYRLVACLPRYSLIELTIGDKKGLCYTGGATSGTFEVYSIIGDNYDLINDRIIGKERTQNTMSVSTITSIKLRSISVLGKLS